MAIREFSLRGFATITVFIWLTQTAFGYVGRFRCMWREDPSTSMVVGWDQISGTGPVFYFDVVDHGTNPNAYRMSKRPDRIVPGRGMNNHFVRLSGLRPNTVYYFLIKDSEGISRRMSFKTAPADPSVRLSIIAGGDSRNYREARRNANQLVSKLRPTFVLFDGDFTGGDTAPEWREWLDDWQETIGSDGRLFPIVAARGNHEMSNARLIEIFDIPSHDAYYALTFGGNLLRIYTLNSLIASGGNQRQWLESDLQRHEGVKWKAAQYHQPMRPHTAKKTEKDELLLNWAPLFYRYGVRLAIECDAHVVKSTWPVRPSHEAGSYEGFIRDDDRGIVFVGEGCWGAPLRANNDDKPWTRNSGSFNQFKWIFVDRQKIEIRTVKTDAAGTVAEIDHRNPFEPPRGLAIWSPSHGEVVRIRAAGATPPPVATVHPATEIESFSATANGNGGVVLRWSARNEAPAVVYEIQRSTDGGRQFHPINVRQGQGGHENSYVFHDAGNPSLHDLLYRLKCSQPNHPPLFLKAGIPVAQQRPQSGIPSPPKIMPEPGTGELRILYLLQQAADVSIKLYDQKRQQKLRVDFPGRPAGKQLQSLNLQRFPTGEYLLLIEADGRVIGQYQVVKRF